MHRKGLLPIRVVLPSDRDCIQTFLNCSHSLVSQATYRERGSLVVADVSVEQNPRNYLALLGCLVSVNRLARRKWSFPPLYESGIGYEEEHEGEEFRSLPALHLLGSGDCDDLVPARLSELPSGSAIPKIVEIGRDPLGGINYHFIIQHRHGDLEDPSRILGMR
jgi:hypothetical protein